MSFAEGQAPAAPEASAAKRPSVLTRPLVVAACAVTCCLLWGSAFPMLKVGFALFGIDPSETGALLVFGGVRFTLAGVIVVLVHAALTHTSVMPRGRDLRDAGLLSIFQTTGQYLPYYVGLAHATGVSGAIVQGISVFVSLLVASLVFRMERLTGRKLVGCAIGFLGLLVVDLGSIATGGGFTLEGEGLIVLSSVFAAMSSPVMRKLTTTRDVDSVVLSGWQFVIGGITLAAVGLALGGSMTISTPAQAGVLGWLVLVSAVAYSLWGMLLAHNDVSHVTVYGFTNNIFGVLLSLAILGDEGHPVGPATFVSLALVCLGIYIVSTTSARAARAGGGS